jgi:hypothetical protein
MTEITQSGFGTVSRLMRDLSLFEETAAEEIYSRGFQDQIANKGVRMIFDPVDLSQLPRFVQTEAGLAERMKNITLPLAFLVVFNALLFALAFVRGISYDPR